MWKASTSNTPHLPKQSRDRTLPAGFSEFRMIGHRQIWQIRYQFRAFLHWCLQKASEQKNFNINYLLQLVLRCKIM